MNNIPEDTLNELNEFWQEFWDYDMESFKLTEEDIDKLFIEFLKKKQREDLINLL